MTDQVATIETPAKINLGLEILGSRPDGYHEIRTILATVDLVDTLTVNIGGAPFDQPGIPADANVVTRALGALAERVDPAVSFGWSIDKHIPIAAGLGGASGNAAGALIAGNHLLGKPVINSELALIAKSLGSDIPFFLGSPIALASGRGTELCECANLASDVVLIVPQISLANKTTSMYSLLQGSDFSDGGSVQRIRDDLKKHVFSSQTALPNAFLRPLLQREPSLQDLVLMLNGLDLTWSLSGAGPSFYVICSQGSGDQIGEMIRERLPVSGQVFSTRPRTTGLTLVETA